MTKRRKRYRTELVPKLEVFTSGIAIQSKPVVLVPASVLGVCDAVQAKVGGNEFSILLKGGWTGDGFVVSPGHYVIPKQSVGYASVDFDNADVARLTSEGYNCVLHSHPAGMKSFSSTDEESINVNFDASVLYCDGDLCDARVCIRVAPKLKLRLDADVKLGYDAPTEIDGMGNIEVKKDVVVIPYQRYYGGVCGYSHGGVDYESYDDFLYDCYLEDRGMKSRCYTDDYIDADEVQRR